MALTGVDKVKLTKYIKDHANGDMYYLDMCDYLGKRGKIKDYEFLNYFTECVINEFSKDIKISIKHAAKLVSIVGSFVEWMHEEGSEISEETLDKIRTFESLYDEYLNRVGAECDVTFKEECLGEVMEIINRLYPSKNDSESLAKYVVKIKELESRIKELEREIDNLKIDNGVLQTNLDKANTNLESLSTESASKKEELKEKKQYIKSLEKELKALQEKFDELSSFSSNIIVERDVFRSKYEIQSDELLICKNKVSELSSEIERLEKIISEFTLNEENKRLQKQKEEELKNLIYQKLLIENASINDLLKVVESKGISCSVSEISKSLREMRSKINIVNGPFSKNPTYKIVKPRLMADGQFVIDVPSECKYMDVMLVSDFHIKEFDKKVLNGFDMINDYCVENGINLILNLGDFYQGFSAKNLDYGNACKNYNVVLESIEKIPRADGVFHAVLGGNHERNMTHYGFDPIKMLVEGRDDFIDLGYYHSTVSLDGESKNLGKFDLHHPSNFDFPVDLDDNGFLVDGMNEYLDDVYLRNFRSRDDSYIDIFGHTHRSQYNFANSYCYIPPFYECKNGKGACHLRIYFDEATGIKYMVFMPLSVGSKLVKNNEIVYQKVLSR